MVALIVVSQCSRDGESGDPGGVMQCEGVMRVCVQETSLLPGHPPPQGP